LGLAPSEIKRVKDSILTNGIELSEKRTWSMVFYDRKDELNKLFNDPSLTIEETRKQSSHGICACGDLFGASYYATRNNRFEEKTEPLIVEFEVDISDVEIDGRDFLYNFGFQSEGSEELRETICSVFGNKIDPYLRNAWERPKSDYCIAMCDLAIQDPEIIREHHQNNLVIGGRHKTKFCSAFIVRLPIPKSKILGFPEPVDVSKEPDIPIESMRLLRSY
jgi:hypothetical protein